VHIQTQEEPLPVFWGWAVEQKGVFQSAMSAGHPNRGGWEVQSGLALPPSMIMRMRTNTQLSLPLCCTKHEHELDVR